MTPAIFDEWINRQFSNTIWDMYGLTRQILEGLVQRRSQIQVWSRVVAKSQSNKQSDSVRTVHTFNLEIICRYVSDTN